MTALVVVETIVLALLSLLVIGLLRSHAEILRRIGEEPAARAASDGGADGDRPDGSRPDVSHLPAPRADVTPAFDIVGQTLHGSAVKLAMEGPTDTLLAFLSSGCLTCQTFWEALPSAASRGLPADIRLLVVVKDPSFESPSRLRELAIGDVAVVMSSAAWKDYGIALSPYFVHVSADGEVRSEGSAGSWAQVASLLRDAMADRELELRGAR
ncbi:MAG TPA: hypothetical protein VGH10_00295 [Actinomycetota bacterium]